MPLPMADHLRGMATTRAEDAELALLDAEAQADKLYALSRMSDADAEQCSALLVRLTEKVGAALAEYENAA